MTEETMSDRAAREIRAFRARFGWSRADLAAYSGLSQNVIENIESGRRDEQGRRRRYITIDEAEAISDAFGISPFSLIYPDALNAMRGGQVPEASESINHLIDLVARIINERLDEDGNISTISHRRIIT
jgi:transcriptional regulator with XRE-family HTH domain